MTSTQIVDTKGKKVGEVKLAEKVFGVELSTGTMHSHVVREMANARQGSASTLTRTEVRGGGAKPWRQKGTGRARAGSRRSPLWRHGGVIFGPKPRDYSLDMPKKMRRAALCSALTAVRDNFVIVKDFESLKEAKTKEFLAILKDLEIEGKKILVVLDYSCDNCKVVDLSARNVNRVKVVDQRNLGVKDLLDYDVILTNEKTINSLNDRLGSDEANAKAVRPSARKSAKGEEKKPNRRTLKRRENEKSKAKKAAKIGAAKESGKGKKKSESKAKAASAKKEKGEGKAKKSDSKPAKKDAAASKPAKSKKADDKKSSKQEPKKESKADAKKESKPESKKEGKDKKSD